MRRVLVTGANGFVGTWLIRQLLEPDEAGLAVIACTYNPANTSFPADPRLKIVGTDLLDPRQIRDLVRSTAPTAVVHLAGVAAQRDAKADPRRAWDVNLHGTSSLAEAVGDHAPEALFLHVSSAEIYGGSLADSKPVDEHASMAPLNTYAVTKAAADLLIGQMAVEGLKAMRFRPFNHTGPGQSATYAVGSFASQIADIEKGRRPPIIEVGNLDVERDFLDVRDVVRAYDLALRSPAEFWDGRPVNLASGAPRRIGEILEALLSRARVPIEVRLDPERLRKNELARTVGSAKHAERLLGWRPQIAWEKTLADILEFWRSSH